MSPWKIGLLGLCCAALAATGLGQSTVRASVANGGLEADDASTTPSLSDDGRFVAFESLATNLVPGDTNALDDVFVRDLLTGTIVRVSVDSAGLEANGPSVGAVLSADGRFVAFQSLASNLVPGDTNNAWDVFVHELATGQTQRVSLDAAGAQSNEDSLYPVFSADGGRVAFASLARLVAADIDSAWDVYVCEPSSGLLILASTGTGGPSFGGDALSPSLSADGQLVAFESDAPDLVPGDTNGRRDIFVRDLPLGTIARVSLDSAGAQADGDSRRASLSADGLHIAFESGATNLVVGDTNATFDVFVRDLVSGQTRRASVDSTGVQAYGYLARAALSGDGRWVVFHSDSQYLVANDTNIVSDVFLHDMATGLTTRVSVDSPGAEGNYLSVSGSLTRDARCVAFTSLASNFVANDFNDKLDVFVRDRQLTGSDFCYGDGTQSPACPCSNSGGAGRGCGNSAGTLGAILAVTGTTQPDTIVLAVQGELPSALSIVLQGSAELNPAVLFGDGLRCAGGQLKRLYVVHAVLGAFAVPGPGDLALSAQSAALGDPLVPGSQRAYQVYYRDPNASFCPAPQGNTWNVSNAVRISW